VESNPQSVLAVEARIHLAEIDSDLGAWQNAVTELAQAEADIRALDPSPRDPADIRFSIGMIQSRQGRDPEAGRNTFDSLVADYPESPAAPRALLALATLMSGRGEVEEALGYLDRIRDDYPQAEQLAARAMLAKGRILERNDRWSDALKIFRSLPAEHPLSEPALQAPLEIVAHYSRLEDEPAVANELERAEEFYRGFLERYPPGPASVSARQKLVQTLSLQERYGDAVTELVGLGTSLSPSPQGVQFLIRAAQMSFIQLADTARTAEILETAGELFSDADVGRWAASEARRLRNESEK
jgi:TolA-binding protein